jgi:hypothetical protein
LHRRLLTSFSFREAASRWMLFQSILLSVCFLTGVAIWNPFFPVPSIKLSVSNLMSDSIIHTFCPNPKRKFFPG